MRFCLESEWISKNPAKAVKLPRVKHQPTLPFTSEDVEKLLAACDEFQGNSRRLRALISLIRHSGLRIGDATNLERTRIKKGKLFLYTAKTGTPVWCPLPEDVLDELTAFAGERSFWSGRST